MKPKNYFLLALVFLCLGRMAFPQIPVGVEWKYTYGSKGTDYCFAMEKTADGGFVLAGMVDYPSSGDVSQGRGSWVLKLDAAGKID